MTTLRDTFLRRFCSAGAEAQIHFRHCFGRFLSPGCWESCGCLRSLDRQHVSRPTRPDCNAEPESTIRTHYAAPTQLSVLRAVMCAGGYLFECVFVIQSAVAQGMIDLLHFLVEVLSRTLRP
jgi:hypothetical protein